MDIEMNSSMKYINLEGLTPLQIIQKYEELLLQRENIIKQLSNQLNDSQQKYIEVSETIDLLTTKNKELNEKKLKLDKTLNQQRTDKDLLFIKLNNLISENDKLKNLISGK
jgi:chromosome segregation ATPase